MRIVSREAEIKEFDERFITDHVWRDFLRRSKEDPSLKGEFDLVPPSRKRILVYQGNFIGFFWWDIVSEMRGGWILCVGGLYIKPHNRYKNVITSVDAFLNEEAKRRGVSKLGFYTRRRGDSFIRLLGRGWRCDSVVVVREVF